MLLRRRKDKQADGFDALCALEAFFLRYDSNGEP